MQLRVDPALGRRIISLAGPVVLAMISQTLINNVDHILIGRLPEEESLPGQAALAPALILFWAIGGSLSAISVGTQALTARRIGEQEHERAGQVMFNSVFVSLVLSFLAAVGGWFAAPYLFKLVHKDPKVVELGVPFLQYRLAGVVAMVTTISYKSWFDGLGKTRVHMGAAIIMNIINFLLNVGFVFGKWGFPRWGVTGSAIASMLSSYIGLFLMIGWSLRKRYMRTHHHYRLSNFSFKQQWEIARQSVPAGVATIFVMSGFGLFVKIVAGLDEAAGHGPIYSAATQNNINILMLFFTGCMAYGTATATLVGQSMGAKQSDLAERYGWEAVKLGVYLSLAIGLFVVVSPDSILHVWSKDQPVIEAARPILRICGALLPFIVTGLVLTQALFGAGNTKFVMYVEFALHFFCLVPLAYVCGVVMNWGVIGVWCGAFVYILLLSSIMGWKFAEGAWKEIRI